MRWNPLVVLVNSLFLLFAGVTSADSDDRKIAPKVFIVNMFDLEAAVWYNIPEFNLQSRNITVPGFSPRYPNVHCTLDGSVCQLVTGEAEINAGITMAALIYSSSMFDLSKTYFLISGISGINPNRGTIGSVTLARFAVQVGLQHEIDAREIPAGFSTGYFPLGSQRPDQFPESIYGTEVFELNDDLRTLAYEFAKDAKLNDTSAAAEYRAQYSGDSPGGKPPSVVLCDTATSDVFWSGRLLAEAFENTTRLFTNGTGDYCTTQQEDNATLEALLRGAVSGLVDFSRVIVMRAGSNFDRPFEGRSAAEGLFANQGGFVPSVKNTYVAGVRIVEGILKGWEGKFRGGQYIVGKPQWVPEGFPLGGQPTESLSLSLTTILRNPFQLRTGDWTHLDYRRPMSDAASYQQDLNVNNSVSLVSFTLLYYEYFLTFEAEATRMWTQRTLTTPTLIFYINRYVAFFGHLPMIVQHFWTAAPSEYKWMRSLPQICRSLQTYHQYFALLLQIMVAVMLIFRTYALYERNKKVLIVMVLCTVVAIMNGFVRDVSQVSERTDDLFNNHQLTLYAATKSSDKHTTDLVPSIGCPSTVGASLGKRLAAAWIGMLIFDTLIFLLTLYKALRIGRAAGNLIWLLARDGTMYYGMSSILISRLMLNLRDPANLLDTSNSGTVVNGAGARTYPLLSTVGPSFVSNDSDMLISSEQQTQSRDSPYRQETGGWSRGRADMIDFEESSHPVAGREGEIELEYVQGRWSSHQRAG
ncbi:NUP-domain-containing protein [Marasmius fiardii PR-910]|nr:NUP-domain-containing protein [Marasmius fiardii PR-910]